MVNHNGASLGSYSSVPGEDTLPFDSDRLPAGGGARPNSNDADDNDAIDREDAVFLPMEMETEDGSHSRADKATQRRVLLMSFIFLFIAELSMFIMEPPLQEIMEDFVCHEKFPDHRTGAWHETDSRCKDPAVEGILAMARSWMVWAEMVVPLLVQIPYGMMADKYGRRPVLVLSLFGSLLATIWNFVVLLGPDTFSVWQLPAGAIATLIGGGDAVTIAMVWTILTDVLPAEERTSLFYKLHAMMLIMSAAMRPVAGWLMSKDPWLPMWIGLITLAMSVISTLFVPETLHFSRDSHKAPGRLPLQGGRRQSLTAVALAGKFVRAARVEVLRIWHFVFSSKKVMLLVAAYGLSNPGFMAMEMSMLQYMTVRFGWDWSTATYYSIVSKVTSVIVLLGLLPLASRAVERQYRLDPVARDLLLALASIAFIIAGNVMTVVALVPWLLILSLAVHGVGAGFRSQVRALLAETVDQGSLATMSSVVAMVQTVAGLVVTPLFGWLLSEGIKLGGLWMGMPFGLTMICSVIAGIALMLFRVL